MKIQKLAVLTTLLFGAAHAAAQTPAAQPLVEDRAAPTAAPTGAAPIAVTAAAPAPSLTEHQADRPAPDTDDTVWTVSAGTTLVTGNARSFQLTAGTHAQMRRGDHQFTGDLNLAFGVAALRRCTNADMSATGPCGGATTTPITGANGEATYYDWTENSRNLTARVRYDYWFSADDSLFLTVAFRNDPFAALDARVQGQLGWAHNFLNESDGKHRFWSEIGFDVTADWFALNTLPPGMRPSANPFVQAAPRVYLGYDNHLNDSWQFLTGLEALPGLIEQNNGSGNRFDIRVNYNAELRLSLVQNLSASIKFQMLYDSVPSTRVNESIDTTTQVQLTYTLL